VSKPSFNSDVWILGRRPSSDTFQPYVTFSAEHGRMTSYVRISRKASHPTVALDLFDEVSVSVEAAPQGQVWFVREARVLARHPLIGRSYEALKHASAFAATVAQNDVPEEGRTKVYELLRVAFNAFSTSDRPDVVRFKSLYCFARDEGYPVRQQWFPTLPAEQRSTVDLLLRTPLGELQGVASPDAAGALAQLLERLEQYLRDYTELRIE
jgi:hypothetical protein